MMNYDEFMKFLGFMDDVGGSGIGDGCLILICEGEGE